MTIKTCMLTLVLGVAAITLKAQTQYRDNIFSTKLKNGLTVLVVEDNTVPLVTLSMTFKNGSFTESPAYSGTAAVYNYMLLKGNRDYGNADQANYRTSQMAMIKGSSVSEEKATCNFTMPSMFVDEGIKYMNSAMRYPIIDAAELDKAKNQTDKELQSKDNNPYFQLSRVAGDHVWGALANRKMAISTHDNIHAITLSQIDTVKKRYYYPDNALLIIAGRVEHAHIFEKVGEFFSSWEPSGENIFKKWPVPAFKPIAKTDYFTVESANANAPHIIISWQGPNTQNDIASTYAADVFSYIMTQNSSKLSKALVQSGLALGIDFNYLTLNQAGPISFNIRPNPAKLKECLAEAQKQIALFDTDDYITNEQIETAVRKLEINRVRQEEVNTDFANQLSFWWASATFDYFFKYTDNLQKVKKSNLQAYVRKYIKNKPYCAGLLVNPTMRAQLKTDDFFKAN